MKADVETKVLNLNSPLSALKGVGEAKYEQLQEVGLSTISDLLDYWPRRYVDYSRLSLIKDLTPGLITLKVKFSQIRARHARGRFMHLTEAIAQDEQGGKIPVVWFNQPYRGTSLKKDTWYYISGEFKPTSFKLNLTNPTTEEVKELEQTSTARIIPIYPEKLNLNSRLIRSLILQVKDVAKSIPETLPTEILQEYKLISKAEAIWQLHVPESMQALSLAKRRLSFEEILTLQLAVGKNKQFIQKLKSPSIKFNLEDTKELVESLKFKLTDDQRKAAWQILQDLEKTEPMNRMLMGDVGSGKTVVAAIAALQAIRAGQQVAILAPTEVLARQHHLSLTQLLNSYLELEEVSPPSSNKPSTELNPPPGGGALRAEGATPLSIIQVSKLKSRHTILPHNKELIQLAKQNRKNLTKYEAIIWSVVNKNQLGVKFTKQKVIGNYIVDFYCPELSLVLEIDGGYHNYISEEDQIRQKYLESLNLKVLRIQNEDITDQIKIYLQDIITKLKSSKSPLRPTGTSPRGGVVGGKLEEPSPNLPLQGRGIDAGSSEAKGGEPSSFEGIGVNAGSANTSIQLLVSSIKLNQKREVLAQIEDGSAKLIVGTHALLQETVKFQNLSLVIVDEQHRFGVNQRKELQKRVKTGTFPHLLTMTATPIPRSLALILYGELDQSLIKSKPPGRIEIQTKLIPGASKQQVWDKLKEELSLGHAAIFVCPNITDTENSARVSAEKIYAEISKKAWVKKHGIGLLHSKLKAEQKERVMADFASGKINTLVSTTVIEVGIDIPRATLIVIEGAEYFGLAQLHQLRGRVGRSNLPSFCYLVPANNQNIPKRLRYFAENSDGFKLAEYDLEQRGPGQIYGKLQSGALDLRLIDLHDLSLIKSAKSAAEQILNKKLTLSTELKANIQKHQDLEYLN